MNRWKKIKEQNIFVDFNDPYLKAKANNARGSTVDTCPMCDKYLQNCMMDDEGLQMFNYVFYCGSCELFYTLQNLIARGMEQIPDTDFADDLFE